VLARSGLAPRLIERSSGPHDVVCGGFLGWDAVAALRRLGVDVVALGARPISRLRLVSSTRCVEARLPRPAAGLSRRTLDATLLDLAAASGADIARGIAARSAEAGRVRLQDGQELECDALLLATGKHDLRGLARPLADRRDRLAVGLRAALPPSPARSQALAGVVELHLFDGGYAGVLLQEDDGANLCLSVSQARLAGAGGPLPLLTELIGELPTLAERIGADMPEDLVAVAGVPYGWRATEAAPGLFRLGDQGAVIASLAGDGIAIALTSGIDAAEALLTGTPALQWQRRFHSRSRRPLAIAETLRRCAERPLTRSALMTLMRLAPSLARAAARLTRIA
jgi:flavin-dependent dehydrogenase